MKLNTLKDLQEFKFNEINQDIIKTEFSERRFFGVTEENDKDVTKMLLKQLVLKQDLKKEAIKWVKFLDAPCKPDEDSWDKPELRKFWLNRFNITSEDLQ